VRASEGVCNGIYACIYLADVVLEQEADGRKGRKQLIWRCHNQWSGIWNLTACVRMESDSVLSRVYFSSLLVLFFMSRLKTILS
jgi:hypothetical protein